MSGFENLVILSTVPREKILQNPLGYLENAVRFRFSHYVSLIDSFTFIYLFNNTKYIIYFLEDPHTFLFFFATTPDAIDAYMKLYNQQFVCNDKLFTISAQPIFSTLAPVYELVDRSLIKKKKTLFQGETFICKSDFNIKKSIGQLIKDNTLDFDRASNIVLGIKLFSQKDTKKTSILALNNGEICILFRIDSLFYSNNKELHKDLKLLLENPYILKVGPKGDQVETRLKDELKIKTGGFGSFKDFALYYRISPNNLRGLSAIFLDRIPPKKIPLEAPVEDQKISKFFIKNAATSSFFYREVFNSLSRCNELCLSKNRYYVM